MPLSCKLLLQFNSLFKVAILLPFSTFFLTHFEVLLAVLLPAPFELSF